MDTDRSHSIEELEAALGKSEQELVEALGEFGTDGALRDAADKGIRVFGALQASLRASICGSEELKDLVRSNADEVALAAAVADLVAATSSRLPEGTVPVATVAALFVKFNLTIYCEPYWGDGA